MVDQFQALVEKELVNLKQNQRTLNKHSGSNLYRGQQVAMKEFMAMEDVVRKADKGGAVLVLDKGLCIAENKKILGIYVSRSPIRSNPSATFKQELSRLIDEGIQRGILSNREEKFLMVEHPQVSSFHSLPKWHIGGFPPAKFRPIVSGIMSLNENH